MYIFHHIPAKKAAVNLYHPDKTSEVLIFIQRSVGSVSAFVHMCILQSPASQRNQVRQSNSSLLFRSSDYQGMKLPESKLPPSPGPSRTTVRCRRARCCNRAQYSNKVQFMHPQKNPLMSRQFMPTREKSKVQRMRLCVPQKNLFCAEQFMLAEEKNAHNTLSIHHPPRGIMQDPNSKKETAKKANPNAKHQTKEKQKKIQEISIRDPARRHQTAMSPIPPTPRPEHLC